MKVESMAELCSAVVVFPPGTETVTSTAVPSPVAVASGTMAPFGRIVLPACTGAGSPVTGSTSAGADQKPPPSRTTAVTVTRKTGGMNRFMYGVRKVRLRPVVPLPEADSAWR